MTDSTQIREEYPNQVVEIEHTWIPLSDGIRLSARIWMPLDAVDNPVPAILEYIPYRKRDGTRVRDDCRHRYWAGHGYICIRLDIRGTGDSEGLITDEYALSEQNDAIEAIAWIAKQPWCSGQVGMTGISWGGFNSLQVAARRPPALKAIITHCSTDDRYADDCHWMGGCLLTDGFFWGSGFYHMMTRPPDPEIAGDGWFDQWMHRLQNWVPPTSHIWMNHQSRDHYWRHGSICESYDDIECAVYAVGGWEDGYSNAVPRMLANLHCPRKGLVGPWGHTYPEQGYPGPAIGFLQEGLRWWDYWLKGLDTGIMEEDMYRVWMQDYVKPSATLEHVPGRWINEPIWPSPNVETKTLYLDQSGLVANRRESTTIKHSSPQSLGITGGRWCPYGMGGSSPDLAIDQREDDGRSICFDGSILGESLPILGAPTVNLRFSINQPQGLIVVRLMDVAPDGTSKRVSYGLINLTHNKDHEHIKPLVPDEWSNAEITLNDLAHRFAVGHKIRVAISTAYWPIVWPSPAPVNLSIATGDSTVKLPVRKTNGNEVLDFSIPEMAPVGKFRTIEPPFSSLSLSRDLAKGTWNQKLIEDHGIAHIEAINLDVGDGVTCEYSIKDDDPLSATAVWNWHTLRRRKGWDLNIQTTTCLQSTATEFLIDTSIVATLAGKEVFRKNWDERLQRNGV